MTKVESVWDTPRTIQRKANLERLRSFAKEKQRTKQELIAFCVINFGTSPRTAMYSYVKTLQLEGYRV